AAGGLADRERDRRRLPRLRHLRGLEADEAERLRGGDRDLRRRARRRGGAAREREGKQDERRASHPQRPRGKRKLACGGTKPPPSSTISEWRRSGIRPSGPCHGQPPTQARICSPRLARYPARRVRESGLPQTAKRSPSVSRVPRCTSRTPVGCVVRTGYEQRPERTGAPSSTSGRAIPIPAGTIITRRFAKSSRWTPNRPRRALEQRSRPTGSALTTGADAADGW